jgi:solute carrier family 45, member 1/2/4
VTYHAVRETATRFGTLSFLCFSFAMLLTSIVLRACSLRKLRDVVNIWTASQILYAFALLSTFLITTSYASLVFAFYVGISFSITQFAPYAVLGLECMSIKQLRTGAPETGMIMASHNAAISFVQIISAGLCALFIILFNSWELDASASFVLKIGVVPALTAAWQSRKLQEIIREQENIV